MDFKTGLTTDDSASKSLYNLAKQNLSVSLLKLRSTCSLDCRKKETAADYSGKVEYFSLPILVERIKACRGIEVIHLLCALPHSGLRPNLLELLESDHPVGNFINIRYFLFIYLFIRK